MRVEYSTKLAAATMCGGVVLLHNSMKIVVAVVELLLLVVDPMAWCSHGSVAAEGVLDEMG